MQYLSLTFQFIGKAVSAALFGILLLIAFALTAPMGSHEYMGFIVMIITHLCAHYSDLSVVFKA